MGSTVSKETKSQNETSCFGAPKNAERQVFENEEEFKQDVQRKREQWVQDCMQKYPGHLRSVYIIVSSLN